MSADGGRDLVSMRLCSFAAWQPCQFATSSPCHLAPAGLPAGLGGGRVQGAACSFCGSSARRLRGVPGRPQRCVCMTACFVPYLVPYMCECAGVDMDDHSQAIMVAYLVSQALSLY